MHEKTSTVNGLMLIGYRAQFSPWVKRHSCVDESPTAGVLGAHSRDFHGVPRRHFLQVSWRPNGYPDEYHNKQGKRVEDPKVHFGCAKRAFISLRVFGNTIDTANLTSLAVISLSAGKKAHHDADRSIQQRCPKNPPIVSPRRLLHPDISRVPPKVPCREFSVQFSSRS